MLPKHNSVEGIFETFYKRFDKFIARNGSHPLLALNIISFCNTFYQNLSTGDWVKLDGRDISDSAHFQTLAWERLRNQGKE